MYAQLKKISRTLCAMLVVLLMDPSTTMSYVVEVASDGSTVRWHEFNQHYKLNTTSFSSEPDLLGAGQTYFNNALGKWKERAWAIDQFWTEVGDCPNYIDPNNFENVGINDIDGILATFGAVTDNCNSVSFIDNACEMPSISFVNHYLNLYGKVKSQDIWFDNACTWWPWNASEFIGPPQQNGGIPKSFEGEATHAIGESMYLGFEPGAVAVRNGGRNFGRPMADDLNGLNYIYNSYDRPDVSVSSMKVANGGGLAMNQQTQTINPDTGGVTQVQLEYTIMNLNLNPVDHVGVKFYLGSTNPNDSAPIRTLGISYFDLGAYAWGTYTRTLYIPSGVLQSGDYGLWFKIDGGDNIDEYKEDNNTLKHYQNVHVVHTSNVGGTTTTNAPTK